MNDFRLRFLLGNATDNESSRLKLMMEGQYVFAGD